MKNLKWVAMSAFLLLAGCDAYTPQGRAVGGGLIGGGVGAGAAALMGANPATGALIGAGIGAVGGAITAPSHHYRYY